MNIEQLVDSVESFESLPHRHQAMYMAFFYSVSEGKPNFTASEIEAKFRELHLDVPNYLAQVLHNLTKAKPPYLIKTKEGYVFQRGKRKEFESKFLGSTPVLVTSKTLRDLLPKIKSKEQNTFLEEAVKCFEIQAFRASVMMTWLLTMDVIYEYVIANKLRDFNAGVQAHGKYKKITFVNKDQFSEMKESEFIEVLRTSKIISNDIRKILVEKLDFRNTCAHPNTIAIKETKAIAVIDDLIENVIFKYQ